MDTLCIVLANEPHAYREVLASALQHLRPHYRTEIATPETLDGTVAQLHPQFVVCNRASAIVQLLARTWIVLYPDGERRAVISVDGCQTSVVDLELERILTLADQTAYRASRS